MGRAVLEDGASLIGHLVTAGRVSGRPHRVTLRLVYYRDNFYASRRDGASEWCRNLMESPAVTVHLGGEQFAATATPVEDAELAKVVSSLKYRDKRALSRRFVVEIVPTE